MGQKQSKCEICLTHNHEFCDEFTKRLTGDTKPDFQVVKCKTCGLHSLYPIPSDSDLKWIYSNYSFQGDRLAVEKSRIQKIYPEKIKKIKHYHNNPKILDIGSGLGGFCYVGKSENLDVCGLEMEAEQVQIAKKEFDIELVNISIERFISTNSQTFNVVHLHHVLEHLRHPKSVLTSIGKLLAPDGIVIFEIPNQFFVFRDELKIKFKIKSSIKPYNPYHHIYFFSPDTLKKLIFASGYKILEFNQLVNNPKNIKLKIHKALATITNMGYSNRIEVVIRKT